MHKNAKIPSTYHQCLKYPLWRGQGTIAANNDRFLKVEANHVDTRFYKEKIDQDRGTGVVEGEDIPIIIVPISSLVVFTKPITQLNC